MHQPSSDGFVKLAVGFTHRRALVNKKSPIVELLGMTIMIIEPGGDIMSAPYDLLSAIYSLALLLAAILALWLAGRMILRNISQIRGS